MRPLKSLAASPPRAPAAARRRGRDSTERPELAETRLSELERRVTEEIAEGRDELVGLASALIGFDTTAREVGDAPREEATLQEYLAGRLEAIGAAVDLWEPSAEELAGRPLVPEGLTFERRPQLAAHLAGKGDGRSLLLNGHIDVVSSEPREHWTSDPNQAEVREGKLYGRGSCDMKGGLAAMVFAAETLTSLGIRLVGDLTLCTNTDEESCGAGGMALVAHGVRADAGIVPEPTGFDAWIACRGSSFVTVEVPGRPGHAEMPQPHWREGGAVNAIEKAALIIDEIRRLREDWHNRDGLRHPYLAPGDIVPTVVTGGEWGVTYPASCRLRYVVAYPPTQADAEGWSTVVERELDERVARVTACDDWLGEHPPSVSWSSGVMPMEVSLDEPIIQIALGAGADLGKPGNPMGLDSWFDGATFTRFAATPTIAFGPSGLDGERMVAHTVDEFVSVDDLVTCAQALALAAMRYCGTAA